MTPTQTTGTQGNKTQGTDGESLRRGTITLATTALGLIFGTAGFLAEEGHTAESRQVARLSTSGTPSIDHAEAEIAKVMAGLYPADADGKGLYFGRHPFMTDGRFGLWRTELRDQIEARRKQREAVETRKAERLETRKAEAERKLKAEQERNEKRLAKLREQAEKLGVTLAPAPAEPTPAVVPNADMATPQGPSSPIRYADTADTGENVRA